MGIRSIICLLENKQLDHYYVRGRLNLHKHGLLGYYESQSLQVRHSPMTDYQRPPEMSMQNVLAAYDKLSKPVLIHCSAGIDRTTPVAAFILQHEMHSLLLQPPDMPPIQGIQIPQELYWILRDPAPLAGMCYPSTFTPWRDLKAAGFSHVVCLTDDRPQYDPTPLTIVHAVKLQDLVHGGVPQNPKKEEHLIRRAVSAVAGKFFAGVGVIVHCVGGAGRTGTVIGCFLCAMGISSSGVLAYLDGLNKSRGKGEWPDSDWQTKMVECFQTDHQSR